MLFDYSISIPFTRTKGGIKSINSGAYLIVELEKLDSTPRLVSVVLPCNSFYTGNSFAATGDVKKKFRLGGMKFPRRGCRRCCFWNIGET